MTGQLSFTALDYLAEGASDGSTETEKGSVVKTMTVPKIVTEYNGKSPADTGIIAMVNVEREGKDEAEGQDAARPQDETRVDPVSQTAAVTQDAARTPTVLIVEDTTELAEVIQATLERMNIRTLHETHGGRAIQTLTDKDPDLVLLDISLPDMTGWKILDVIKEKHEQDPSEQPMPLVIVITAYGDPANRLVGKLQGVHDYLIKPFTADEVEKAVMGALSSPAH